MAGIHRAPFLPAALLLFLAAALLASCSCYASPHATAVAAGDEKAARTMGRIADPKCSAMTPCTPANCMDYCSLIGIVRSKSFCTARGLQFYCCCSVPFQSAAAAAKTPEISS